MLFMHFNVRCELAPRTARANKNVTELEVLRVQESAVI